MKIGYHLGYWAAGPPQDAAQVVRAVEDLGFDSLWTAEAYGSDCFTPSWRSSAARTAHWARVMPSARTRWSATVRSRRATS